MSKVFVEAETQQGSRKAEVATTESKLPILDLLEKEGMVLSYGCRAGSCGVCRVEITEGIELLEEKNILEEDTLSRCQDGPRIRLACQAKLKEGAVGTIKIYPAPPVVLRDEP